MHTYCPKRERLSRQIFYCFTNHNSFEDSCIRLAGVKDINPPKNFSIRSKLWVNIKIPLPPLEVQREIVAEIEGYQRVIDGARAVIDNYRPQIVVDPEWPMVELGGSLVEDRR